MTEPAVDPPDHTGDPARHWRLRQWIAPPWFLLGVLVSLVGFVVMTTFGAKPGVDPAALRQAAREGALEASATLQAGGPQPASSTPSAPAGRSFSGRDANRAGDKSAPVTIVEFSDFQ